VNVVITSAQLLQRIGVVAGDNRTCTNPFLVLCMMQLIIFLACLNIDIDMFINCNWVVTQWQQ